MDKFSFFFAFYGLILGLAAAEILTSLGHYVRNRALRRIEPQTALLALLTFLLICITWIDAWETLRNVSLDVSGLWAPVLLATAYYLAATVVLPRDIEGDLAVYYAERKRFVLALLLLSELMVTYTYLPQLTETARAKPVVFWVYIVPLNLAMPLILLALMFVRGRRTNITLLILTIALYLMPYWSRNAVSDWVHAQFG